jgi:hypothetical protein
MLLYVCTYVFLLYEESFNMIIVNNSSFYDGGITTGIRAVSKLNACQRTLKMTNNIFTVRNVFWPHKDYSNFFGGKLTIFKFCNYRFVLTSMI